MSLGERFEKLEPRERRLLTLLLGVIAIVVFLLVPFGVWSVVSTKRDENAAVRALIQEIYEARPQVAERKARRDQVMGRYAKPAPPLAGFIEESARAHGLAVPESQDRPENPHGKRYSERLTVVKMHKIGMGGLAKMLERIEQSGHPVAISKLHIKPRAGEPDSYEVELGVSAFDKKGGESKEDARAQHDGGVTAGSAAPPTTGKPTTGVSEEKP